jgi:hypothetical protein
MGVTALVAAGCRPGVGSRCDKGDARCLDGTRSLACESEKYIEVPCRGPGGCRSEEKGTSCDISRNQPGDRCSRDEEGAAACVDPKRLLTCRQGKFETVACHGPKGCLVEYGHATCDATLGDAGEACRENGKKACALDGSRVLECRENVLVPLYACRGERRCSVASGRLDCDVSVALEGDACDVRLEGHIACAMDRKRTLICKNSRFALDALCKPGMSCTVSGNETRCGKSAT